jgi:hypothetical protein
MQPIRIGCCEEAVEVDIRVVSRTRLNRRRTMQANRAKWAFTTASVLFLVAAVASFAGGNEGKTAFLVLGVAFLAIAMRIGRGSHQ